MKFPKLFNRIIGDITVRVEGFFTERVINICKTKGIKIWNIKNINSGIIEFNVSAREVKRIITIVKKCKCKLKIIKKNGIYFRTFKYRKRKIVVLFLVIFICLINIYNKFIWNIKVEGEKNLSKYEILNIANNLGIHIGTFKPAINTNYIIKCMKRDLKDVAWVGFDIKGTNLIIKVIEKTNFPNEMIYDSSVIGNIVASKSGVITKVIAENGTVIHKEGSYVEEGMTVIEGKMKSELLGESKVRASGIVMANVEYKFEKEFKKREIIKKYNGKKAYNIGFSINNKEFYLNYLNKNKKYDKLKKSLCINLFGLNISLDIYFFDEYYEIQTDHSTEELIKIAQTYGCNYKYSLEQNGKKIVSESENVTNSDDGIIYSYLITVNESIALFKGE